MTRRATIWHNPRCSKSRAALVLLEQAGVSVTERRYLDQPPSREEVVELLEKLAIPARDLVRRSEPAYAALALADADEDGLVDAIVRHPVLLERPVVLVGERALVARPPERALELLE